MARFLASIPLRESRALIVACLLLFGSLVTVALVVDPPEKQERKIERFIKEGRLVAPEAYVPVWLYKGLKVNIALAGALLLVSPWLGTRRDPKAALVPAPARVPWTTLQSFGLLLLVGTGIWLNTPRLSLSMWGDEEFNASRFILDQVEHQPDGTVTIEPRPWATTLWNVRKPTNHLGYSALARLSHDTFFNEGSGPEDPWFSEALLRAPVFVAGLLALLALMWSLRVWGLSGWPAVVFLVIHPWFVRFGVDGRGYGLVMLGIAFLMGALGRAVQTGKWRWWVLFGLGQFFVVWSNFQSVYLLAALNLAALACFASAGIVWKSRRLLASRWLVGNSLTAILIIGMLSPCLPQIQEFLVKREIAGTMDLRWWQDCFCAWGFGQPWFPWDEPANPLLYGMALSLQKSPVIVTLGIVALASLLLHGACVLARDRSKFPLLIIIVAGPALMLLHMAASGNRPYDWYFVPFLPGLLSLLAASAGSLQARSRFIGGGIFALALALFFFTTLTPRELLRNHPIEASRDSVASYRQITTPRNPDIEKSVISGGLSMYTEGYDPALIRVRNAEDFSRLLAEADRSGRQLYFNVGYMRFLRTTPGMGPLCAILDDPEKFEHTGYFPGLLPYTSRDVYRYRGTQR